MSEKIALDLFNLRIYSESIQRIALDLQRYEEALLNLVSIKYNWTEFELPC